MFSIANVANHFNTPLIHGTRVNYQQEKKTRKPGADSIPLRPKNTQRHREKVGARPKKITWHDLFHSDLEDAIEVSRSKKWEGVM